MRLLLRLVANGGGWFSGSIRWAPSAFTVTSPVMSSVAAINSPSLAIIASAVALLWRSCYRSYRRSMYYNNLLCIRLEETQQLVLIRM